MRGWGLRIDASSLGVQCLKRVLGISSCMSGEISDVWAVDLDWLALRFLKLQCPKRTVFALQQRMVHEASRA